MFLKNLVLLTYMLLVGYSALEMYKKNEVGWKYGAGITALIGLSILL